MSSSHVVIDSGLPPAPVSLTQWDELEFADGQRFELVEGMLVQMAPPRPKHSNIASKITALLNHALPEDFIAVREISVVLQEAPTTVRTPDVAVIPMSLYERDPVHVSASDVVLAVEVVSPSSRRLDLLTKRLEYEEARVPQYWAVDHQSPEQANRFHAWKLVEGLYQRQSALIGDEVRLDEPCPLAFLFDELLAR